MELFGCGGSTRNADILEGAPAANMDTISHAIFEPEGMGAHRPRQAIFRHPDRDRPQKGDLTSKVRESLVSVGRGGGRSFAAGGSTASKWSKDMREAAEKPCSANVISLTDHASYLSNKITFVLDAMLGVGQSRAETTSSSCFSVMAVVLIAADPDRRRSTA